MGSPGGGGGGRVTDTALRLLYYTRLQYYTRLYYMLLLLFSGGQEGADGPDSAARPWLHREGGVWSPGVVRLQGGRLRCVTGGGK